MSNSAKQTILPREKVALYGIENTFDHELIALILGSGTKKKSVLKIAKSITQRHPLSTWQHLTADDFSKIQGCGHVKSLQLAACIELGKRIYTAPTPPLIQTSSDAYNQVSYLIKRKREEVLCLYLNARNELISKQTVAVGGVNYSSIHPRDVFSHALSLPCAQLILVHNHPSGNLEPSREDIYVTQTIQAAGQLLGIHLLDHIIVGDNAKHSNCVSLAEIGLITNAN